MKSKWAAILIVALIATLAEVLFSCGSGGGGGGGGGGGPVNTTEIEPNNSPTNSVSTPLGNAHHVVISGDVTATDAIDSWVMLGDGGTIELELRGIRPGDNLDLYLYESPDYPWVTGVRVAASENPGNESEFISYLTIAGRYYWTIVKWTSGGCGYVLDYTNYCTDEDGDGLFNETGCGTEVDCIDTDSGELYCPIKEDSLTLSSTPPNSGPSIAFTGSEYGVAWSNAKTGSSEIYFTRVSEAGAKIGAETMITAADGFESVQPALIYRGGEFALVWADERNETPPDPATPYHEIFFTKIADDGAKIGGDTRLSFQNTSNPVIEGTFWTGPSVFMVAYLDYVSYEIYRQAVETDGTPGGPSQASTSGSSMLSPPAIARRDMNTYGLAWTDASQFHLRLAADTTYGPATATIGERPALIYANGVYGCAWVDHRTGTDQIYFARVNNVGAMLGPEVRATFTNQDCHLPALAFANGEYALVWIGQGGELYFTALSEFGLKMRPDFRLGTVSDVTMPVSLVYAWTDYGLAIGGAALKFLRISYP